MLTLDDFKEPAQEEDKEKVYTEVHTVKVGKTLLNWRTAMMVALETVGRYGHAIITSNGSLEKPATLWIIRRVIH